MLRDAGTRLQAPEGRDTRHGWRYSDAGGGHRIDASLRLVCHRLRRGATSHNADGGRNGAKARRMQVASPDYSRVTGNSELTDGPILTSGLPTNRAESLHLVVDRGIPTHAGGRRAGLQSSGKSLDAGAERRRSAMAATGTRTIR